MPLKLFLDRLTDRGLLRGLENSQSNEGNIFCVDNPRIKQRVLCVETKWRTTRDSSHLALSIHFVNKREYNKVFVTNTSGTRRWKNNPPSWFLLEERSEGCSSTQAESLSKKDEAQSVIGSDDERSENNAHVEIESDDESNVHERSSSYPSEGSDEGNTRKKILQGGKG